MSTIAAAWQYIGEVEIKAIDFDLPAKNRLYDHARSDAELGRKLSTVGPAKKAARRYLNKRYDQTSSQLIESVDPRPQPQ